MALNEPFTVTYFWESDTYFKTFWKPCMHTDVKVYSRLISNFTMTADHELKIYHLPRSFYWINYYRQFRKKCLLLVKHYFDVSSHEAFLSKLSISDFIWTVLTDLYITNLLFLLLNLCNPENVSRLKKLEYLNLALNNVTRVENLEGEKTQCIHELRYCMSVLIVNIMLDSVLSMGIIYLCE